MARIRSVLSAVGAVLTGAGVLILLFVAYQLWGTGLYTARAQDALKDEFEAKIAAPTPATTTAATAAATTTTTTTNAVASVAAPPPPSGEAVAVIRIPRIGVDQAVVEGVSVADLRKGPGHYPSTPLPGEAGNAAIAGHRTTYGAPFNRLDELAAGDEVLVITQRGNSTYRVLEKKIVRPDQVEVLDPTPEPRLTLTTCHPKYSAAKRLIVVAGFAPGETAPPPSPAPTATGPETNLADQLADPGLATDRSKLPTVAWGAATALVGATWWWAVRRRHWTTYLAGALGFLAVLFVFYAHLELLLPANF
jgi:sortase A